MRFNTLNEWLTWQESLNPKEIDLGLERVSRVLQQAGLPSSFNCPLITVAGTNGKGSVVATLEAIAKTAGLTVCSYTSPHIFQYNERIKINGSAIEDAALCEAFERIDQARCGQIHGDTVLTYFEFGTLAAIDLFFRQQPDLVILEVGLGGRLDAVNTMDADISILTSVAIDHVDWLGDNRESIGHEKAGVFRRQKPVVCGEADPPQSVIDEVEKLQCEFLLAGSDFKVINQSEGAKVLSDCWNFESSLGVISGLPQPKLSGEFQKSNAAMAVMAMQLLQAKALPNFQFDLAKVLSVALREINLPGRFQQLKAKPQVVVDVAHNPQAALALSSQLKSSQPQLNHQQPGQIQLDSTQSTYTQSAYKQAGKTWAIVAMLADKDVNGVLENLLTDIDVWCLAGLENVSRGLSVQGLLKSLPDDFFAQTKLKMTADIRHDLALNQCTMLSETVMLASSVARACELVLSKASVNDQIIIFGSFYTVAEAMQKFSELDSNGVP